MASVAMAMKCLLAVFGALAVVQAENGNQVAFTEKTAWHLAGCQNHSYVNDLCFDSNPTSASVSYKHGGKLIVSAQSTGSTTLLQYGSTKITRHLGTKTSPNEMAVVGEMMRQSVGKLVIHGGVKLTQQLLDDIMMVQGIENYRAAFMPLYFLLGMLQNAAKEITRKRKSRSAEAEPMPHSSERYFSIVRSRFRRDVAECDADSVPDPDDDCFGMCGRKCKCWKFICGDCCVHEGCRMHDTCCRKSFFSAECLFPVGLTCDSFPQGENC